MALSLLLRHNNYHEKVCTENKKGFFHPLLCTEARICKLEEIVSKEGKETGKQTVTVLKNWKEMTLLESIIDFTTFGLKKFPKNNQ